LFVVQKFFDQVHFVEHLVVCLRSRVSHQGNCNGDANLISYLLGRMPAPTSCGLSEKTHFAKETSKVQPGRAPCPCTLHRAGVSSRNAPAGVVRFRVT
jgi:hypothetical protein